MVYGSIMRTLVCVSFVLHNVFSNLELCCISSCFLPPLYSIQEQWQIILVIDFLNSFLVFNGKCLRSWKTNDHSNIMAFKHLDSMA